MEKNMIRVVKGISGLVIICICGQLLWFTHALGQTGSSFEIAKELLDELIVKSISMPLEGEVCQGEKLKVHDAIGDLKVLKGLEEWEIAGLQQELNENAPGLGEILSHYKLLPQYEIPSPEIGMRIYISNRFMSFDRAYHWMFIKKGGKIHTRILYRSASQGIFRMSDGVTTSDWIGKGVREEYTTLHPDYQSLLTKYAGPIVRKIELDPERDLKVEELFPLHSKEYYQLLPYKKDPGTWKRMMEDYNKDGTLMIKIMMRDVNTHIPDRRLGPNVGGMYREWMAGELELEVAKQKYNFPDDPGLEIPAPLEPDFSVEYLEYEKESSLSGKVRSYVYPSKDGTLLFTFDLTASGHLMLADVSFKENSVNKWGTQKRYTDLQLLTKPLWEYSTQISYRPKTGIKHPLEASYEFNWPQVRRIPVIQKWYSAKGMALPDTSHKAMSESLSREE